MDKVKRDARIGERIFLKRDDASGNLFFYAVAEPDADLILDTGWEFTFSQPLKHRDGDGKHVTTSGNAELTYISGAAAFLFENGDFVWLEDIIVEKTTQLTRIA